MEGQFNQDSEEQECLGKGSTKGGGRKQKRKRNRYVK